MPITISIHGSIFMKIKKNSLLSIFVFAILISSVSVKDDLFVFDYETPRILATTITLIVASIYFLCFNRPIVHIQSIPFLLTVMLIAIYLLAIPQQNLFFIIGIAVGFILLYIILISFRFDNLIAGAFFL